jgi:alpha-glucosidase
MKPYLLLIALLITAGSFSQQPYPLLSPDKTIRVEIDTYNQLTYSIYVDDKRVINESVIDMQLPSEISLSYLLRIKSIKTKTVNETIVAQIPISRKNIPNNYNELTITFKNNFAVIFRAYDDGVAYRIVTAFKDSITVINETAQFNFAEAAHAYAPIIQKREGLDVFHTSFEELYPYKSLDSLSTNDYMYSPVLVNTNDNIKVAVTESDLDDYPGMFLRGSSSNTLTAAFAPSPSEERVVEGDYPAMVVSKRTDYIAKTNGTRNFPWRVLLIARKDKELPANDLVYRLASPTKIEDAIRGYIRQMHR